MLAGIAASLFSLSAVAQGPGPGPKPPVPRDCSKAKDPTRCVARHKAFEACKDSKAGPERRECLKANRPAPPGPKKS
jgi:hypothetical protein